MNLFRIVTFILLPVLLHAADQPQWGQAWSRNMVSSECGLPTDFDPKTGKNIKWVAKLGNETHSTPIVANGRVYIGTNNQEPRDPKYVGDRGVLMCFDEKTGKLLWQLVVPKREEDKFHDWPNTGWSSPVTVEGDRVYTITSRGEVVCLDAKGMANGNDGPFKDEGAHTIQKPMAGETTQSAIRNPKSEIPTPGPLDADILWFFDLTKGAGIWSHDGAHSSVLIYGNHLYLNSGTGVDNTHRKIRTPDAPSLVVFDKRNGEYLARDDEHIAPNIFHCTWSAPSLGVVNGKPVIFFCGGNGVVYGFEPLATNSPSGTSASPSPGGERRGEGGRGRVDSTLVTSATQAPRTLKQVFQFDFDPAAPKAEVHRFTQNRREGPSNIFGMPVFLDGKLYVAGGGDIFWGKNEAWLKCIEVTTFGEDTRTNAIWTYPLEKHVMATPAVYDGLVFISDCGRKMHCLEAATGKPLWTHDIKGDTWASPYVADGKVYLGTRSGNFYVWAASKEKQVLSELDLKIPISGTTTAANGVLYVATMQNLYAIQR
jgi:outer membrane protein assembly factor BamB